MPSCSSSQYALQTSPTLEVHICQKETKGPYCICATILHLQSCTTVTRRKQITAYKMLNGATPMGRCWGFSKSQSHFPLQRFSYIYGSSLWMKGNPNVRKTIDNISVHFAVFIRIAVLKPCVFRLAAQINSAHILLILWEPKHLSKTRNFPLATASASGVTEPRTHAVIIIHG